MVSDFSSNCKSFYPTLDLSCSKKVIGLAKEGFIPGPKESEEAFIERAEMTKKEAIEKKIPFSHLDWPKETLKELFDINPSFLPIFYSNHSLFFWQGAASWVGENGEILIQMRKGFQKGSYFGYSRDELIAHEAVHAARCAFDEPQFEEFFAYFTSEKWWRKILGPMIQRPWEVWPLWFFCSLSFFSSWAAFFVSCWVGLGAIRWVRNFWTLRSAFLQILKEVKEEKVARAILVRLTDEEITLFAKGQNVVAYGAEKKELRWQLLQFFYLRRENDKKN